MKTFAVGALIVIAGLLVTLLPVELWFLIWHIVGPSGFWQKALMTGFGIWMFGGAQIVFLFLGLSFTFISMSDYLDGGRR